ncbi:MAG: phosphatase PAP2 family protein [Ignavibacteria bacterium]|nr:phosphatase PAP2 family protein [Ignavibacteria bacterium]
MLKSETLLNSLKKNIKYLEIPDKTNLIFLTALSLLIVVNYYRINQWYLIVVVNTLLSISILYIVGHYEQKELEDKTKQSLSRFIRFWYPAFMMAFCFKEIYVLMISLTNSLYDHFLIGIDYMIFGVNPTQALFVISNPALTEFFQIVYNIFYLMPLIYGLELYLWHRYDELKYATFVILFGFYISLIGYLLLPAIGPRFTLHDFHTLNLELPGIFLTNILRDIINFGESIPKGIPNPGDVAQRDAFPSGHTIIILLITYLSHKIRSKSFYFYLPYSILMIFSTVYLRYHYVIDLAAGGVIVLFTIFITNRIYKDKLPKILKNFKDKT